MDVLSRLGLDCWLVGVQGQMRVSGTTSETQATHPTPTIESTWSLDGLHVC
jgi:hypothetical protein